MYDHFSTKPKTFFFLLLPSLNFIKMNKPCHFIILTALCNFLIYDHFFNKVKISSLHLFVPYRRSPCGTWTHPSLLVTVSASSPSSGVAGQPWTWPSWAGPFLMRHSLASSQEGQTGMFFHRSWHSPPQSLTATSVQLS